MTEVRLRFNSRLTFDFVQHVVRLVLSKSREVRQSPCRSRGAQSTPSRTWSSRAGTYFKGERVKPQTLCCISTSPNVYNLILCHTPYYAANASILRYSTFLCFSVCPALPNQDRYQIFVSLPYVQSTLHHNQKSLSSINQTELYRTVVKVNDTRGHGI